MSHTRRQVREIIGAQGMSLVAVLQSARTLQNEIDFFFAIIENTLAVSVGIHSNFGKTRDASQNSIVWVACPEDWFVVAGCGGGIRFRLVQARQVPVQPSGVDSPILGRK